MFLKFQKYGASVNAYTNHYETCYYFSCFDNFNKCLELLLDFVQSPYFTDENTEKEKGIIEQEIDMTNDRIDYLLYVKQLENTLKNNPNRNTTIGDKENIRKITKEDLYDCYNTFYHPSNMMLVISGDINVDEVLKLIKENQSKKTFTTKNSIKLPTYNENKDVVKGYEHITKNVTSNRLSICYKMIYPKLEGKELYKLKLFLSMFVDMKFGATTNFEKKLIDEKIIKSSFSYEYMFFDNIVLLMFDADILDKEKFINVLDQYLKDNNFDERIFNLTKKAFLASMVRTFDTPGYIARKIYSDIIKYNEITNYSYVVMSNYKYDDFIKQIETLNYDNKSILYVTKNKEE
mgnify:CR=1 FL=1